MTYAKLSRDLHPRTLRGIARHVTLSTLALFWQQSGRIEVQKEKRRVQFLYLHHVLPDEEQPFRQLLTSLTKSYRFISYSEAVARVWSGNIDDTYLTLSFDDGFKNCLKAVSIMNEVGAKACFFVCPPMVGETDFGRIERFCCEKLRKLPLEFMNWADLEHLLLTGHEIGGHTMSHPNLAEIPVVQVEQELNESFTILRQRFGKIKHFAWPYGKSACITPQAAKAIFEVGYESCASGMRGSHVVGQLEKSALCIRRDHVMATWPVGHVNYFLSRSSARASLKDNRWPWELI